MPAHNLGTLYIDDYNSLTTLVMFFFQSGVTDVSIHPSGKLALSIGKDRKLVTWNLIKGRSAYVTNIKDMANFVKWSPTGRVFFNGAFRTLKNLNIAI